MACTALNVRGEPCKALPPKGASLCLLHDPDRRGWQDTIHRVGGEARKAQRAWTVTMDKLPGDLETTEDGVRWAASIARLVATGELDGRTGDVVLKAIREHRESSKIAVLERRVRELEAKLQEAQA